MALNQKDMKIITTLRSDARLPLATMARRTGIPTSTLFDKLRHNTIIKGYTSLLDFAKLGFKQQVTILLSSRNKGRLELFLLGHPCVNTLFKLGNSFDFIAEGIFRDTSELNGFLSQLNSFEIEDILTISIAADLKREGFLGGF